MSGTNGKEKRQAEFTLADHERAFVVMERERLRRR